MEISITLPFVFWNKNASEPEHRISCMKINDEYMVTGSETGEICIWSKRDYTAQVICTLGKISKCLSLDFVYGPIPELVGSDLAVATLHSDNKIRVWDIIDGRCISTSSSILLPNYKFDLLLTIQRQFIAVAGENSDIMLVDLWSMESVGYFSMTNPVVCMDYISDQQLWALDTNGSLRSFAIPQVRNYFHDKNYFFDLCNIPNYSYNIKDEVRSFSISTSANVIVVLLKHGLRVYLKEWVQEAKNEYAHIENPDIVKIFCNDKLIIVLKETILILPIEDIIQQLHKNSNGKLIRSKSLTSVKIHDLEKIFESFSRKIDTSYNFSCIFGSDLYGFKENTVILYSLDCEDVRKVEFSFKLNDPDQFSDRCVKDLLLKGEVITYCTTFLTSEWPIYVLGTSLGKIFLCPFHADQGIYTHNYHKSAITCIYLRSDKIISCCKDGLICFCDFKYNGIYDPESLLKSAQEPLDPDGKETKKKVISSSSHTFINLFFGAISKIIRIETISDKKSETSDVLLGQTEDLALVLMSASSETILSTLQAISDTIKEAYYHECIDYYYVLSHSDDLYIFSSESCTLERIVRGPDTYLILRKPLRSRLSTETFEEVVEETSSKQRVTMFNLRQLFPESNSAALKVNVIHIGNSIIQLLVINVLQIVKKIKKVDSPSAQLEYILSLFTCWEADCEAHESLCGCIKDIMKVSKPFIYGNIGTIGVGNCMSFTLPGSKNFFEVSGYITALIMSAGYCIIDALARFIPNKPKKQQKIIYRHKHLAETPEKTLKIPFLPVLALQSLLGTTTSRYILQDNLELLNETSKQKLLETITSLIDEQWTLRSRISLAKNYVGLIEALCSCLLGHYAIKYHQEFKQNKKNVLSMILNFLRCMLKTDNEGYLISSAHILGKGMEYWKSELTITQIKEIVKELLLYGCKESQIYKRVFYKALMRIAVCDFLNFIEILSQEIENIEIDQNYPSSCTQILDMFILKNYEEVVPYLPAVTELIVRTLNPHNPMLRKNTKEKASHALKSLITKLPLVSFYQFKQRLAIGTMDGLIVIYDLVTASQWKILKGHQGSVSAVQFNSNGELLASYSYIDCTIKIWKLKSGFIQDLIGNNNLKPFKTINLEMLSPYTESFRNFLDTVKLNWKNEDAILLRRENGIKYLNKI